MFSRNQFKIIRDILICVWILLQIYVILEIPSLMDILLYTLVLLQTSLAFYLAAARKELCILNVGEKRHPNKGQQEPFLLQPAGEYQEFQTPIISKSRFLFPRPVPVEEIQLLCSSMSKMNLVVGGASRQENDSFKSSYYHSQVSRNQYRIKDTAALVPQVDLVTPVGHVARSARLASVAIVAPISPVAPVAPIPPVAPVAPVAPSPQLIKPLFKSNKIAVKPIKPRVNRKLRFF